MGKPRTWKDAHKSSPYYRKLKKAGYYKKPPKRVKGTGSRKQRDRKRRQEASEGAEARALYNQQREAEKAAKKTRRAERRQRTWTFLRDSVLPRIMRVLRWGDARLQAEIEKRRTAK